MSSMCGKYHEIVEIRTFADRFECSGSGPDVLQNGPNSKNFNREKISPLLFFTKIKINSTKTVNIITKKTFIINCCDGHTLK